MGKKHVYRIDKVALKVKKGTVYLKGFKTVPFPKDLEKKVMTGNLEATIKEFVENDKNGEL